MNEFIEKLKTRLSDMFAESEECVHKMCESKTDEECNMVTCEQCYVAEMNKIVNELAEEYKPSMTNGGCVDCDECEHRSEDCLCDISENEEECPLLSNNGWIPCENELPKENGYYLVTYKKNGNLLAGYWLFNGIDFNQTENVEVLYWQPLPEPYNPKGE